MTKQELRKIYQNKRKELSVDSCASFNLQIYNQFFSTINLSSVKTLHTYLPIEKNNEPDTWMLIDRLRREFNHIRIVIPKISAEHMLENYYFEGLHQMRSNSLGIPEPKQGVPAPSDKIDMVIVPLLIFDLFGHRVGYGKGYYDRFLKSCRKDTVKVGLSWFDPVEKIDDVDAQDVALNFFITPKKVFNFASSL